MIVLFQQVRKQVLYNHFLLFRSLFINALTRNPINVWSNSEFENIEIYELTENLLWRKWLHGPNTEMLRTSLSNLLCKTYCVNRSRFAPDTPRSPISERFTNAKSRHWEMNWPKLAKESNTEMFKIHRCSQDIPIQPPLLKTCCVNRSSSYVVSGQSRVR